MEDLMMKKFAKFSLMLALLVTLTSLVAAQPSQEKEQKYNQYLINSLMDQNIGIRCSAAQLLGERKVVEAVEPLSKMLLSEKNCSARLVAAMALYQIGDDRALPALKKAAEHDKNKTVRHVITAIVDKMAQAHVAQK